MLAEESLNVNFPTNFFVKKFYKQNIFFQFLSNFLQKKDFIFIVRFIKGYCIVTQSVQNFDNRNSYGVPQRPVQSAMHSQPQAVRIPEYYMPNERKSLKEALEENPMYSMGIKGFFGPLIDHPIASVLTWFGCGFLLDKYTSACGGEYDKSLLKKVTNFGDRIENSSFVQSKPMQSFLNIFKKSGEQGGKILQKNSVLRAIWKTPTMPEWEMVKSEMIPQRQRVVHDFNQIVNELKLTTDGYAKLNKLALDKEENGRLKKLASVLNTEEKASSYIQLKRLGVKEDEIMKVISKADGGVADTKKAILKAFGDKDVEWLKKIHEDTIGAKINEVQEATKKVGGKVKIGLGEFKPFGINLGPLNAATKRVLGCDNVYNRLYSLDGGAKTSTGRFMSRFMQMVHRGLTFGGGKLGVLLFIAPAFVETAINVHKAEPNQKVGTGVSNLVNHISWVFTFPFALQIMHHICGAKYAGLTEDQVQNIRKKVADFNKDNKAGKFADYTDWNEKRKVLNKEIKELSKVKGQKWYTKGIRKLAGWLTPDLGKVDAYNTGNWFTTKLSQLRNLPRNLFGVPARLIIFGLLTMGVLDTALNKGIKAIFGDSYDSMKEEEIKDAKKEQKKFLKEDLNERLYETQRRKLQKRVLPTKQPQVNPQGNALSHHGTGVNASGVNSAGVNTAGVNTAGVSMVGANNNAIQQAEIQTADNYSYIPSEKNIIKSEAKGKRDNYSYIPSQDSTIKTDKEKNQNTRSYIPSQAAANISKTWDNSGLQSALTRADRAEQRALKVLAGNFEGM